jgi:hypothetical protein
MRALDYDLPGQCVFGRGQIGIWTRSYEICNGVVQT